MIVVKSSNTVNFGFSLITRGHYSSICSSSITSPKVKVGTSLLACCRVVLMLSHDCSGVVVVGERSFSILFRCTVVP